MISAPNGELAYNASGNLISLHVEVDLLSVQNAKAYIPSGKQLGFSHIEILETPDAKIANELAAIATANGLTVTAVKKFETEKPKVEIPNESTTEIEKPQAEIFGGKKSK